MLTMYDSSHADTIPTEATAVAGYIDGTDSYTAVSRKAPHAIHMSIAVDANDDADCLDVEPTLARVDQVHGWWKRQRARGVARPVIYATTTDMTYAGAHNGNHVLGVLDVLKQFGIARSSVRLWAADYPYSAGVLSGKSLAELESLDRTWPHICGPATCNLVAIPVDGTQWTSWAYCPDLRKYGSLDQSLLVDDFFSEAKPPTVYLCEGQKSLNGLSQQLHNPVSEILRLTAEHSPGAVFYDGMANYLDGVFAADTEKVPLGITVYHRAGDSAEPFHSHGTQTLQGLSIAFSCQPSKIVQLTAENSPGGVFSADMARYLDDVFSRSDTLVPAGIHLYYEK